MLRGRYQIFSQHCGHGSIHTVTYKRHALCQNTHWAIFKTWIIWHHVAQKHGQDQLAEAWTGL